MQRRHCAPEKHPFRFVVMRRFFPQKADIVARRPSRLQTRICGVPLRKGCGTSCNAHAGAELTIVRGDLRHSSLA